MGGEGWYVFWKQIFLKFIFILNSHWQPTITDMRINLWHFFTGWDQKSELYIICEILVLIHMKNIKIMCGVKFNLFLNNHPLKSCIVCHKFDLITPKKVLNLIFYFSKNLYLINVFAFLRFLHLSFGEKIKMLLTFVF